MCVSVIGVEHAFDMTIHFLHDSNPRHHRRTAARHHHRDLDRRLPFRRFGLVGGVAKCDELFDRPAADRILERALPALVSQAILAEQPKKEGRDHDIQPNQR